MGIVSRGLSVAAVALLLLLAGCGGEEGRRPGPPDLATPGAPAEADVAGTPAVRRLAAVNADAAFAAHRGSTLFAGFAPDGTRVLTTSLDLHARLWNLAGEPVAVLAGHVGSIHRAAYAPDGTRIVTASVDHTARVWDADGRPLAALHGHAAEVVSAAFSPDGRRVLTVSLDGSARTWSASGALEATHAVEGEAIRHAAFAAGGDVVVAVTHEGRFHRWGRDAVRFPPSPGGEADSVDAFVVSPTGGACVVLSSLPGETLLDVAGSGGHRRLEAHGAQALAAAFSPDGTRLATGSLDMTAAVWDAGAARLARLEGHGGAVYAVSFSPDGERVLTVSSDRAARLFDLEGRLLAVIGGKDEPVVSAAFSPSGDRILTTPYRRGAAKGWDLSGRLRFVLPDPTGRTHHAVWSPDGAHVLTVDRSLTPHLWRVGPDAPLAEGEEPGAADTEDGAPLRGDYAGTVACAACHRAAYEAWSRSSHARTSYFPNEADLPPDVLAERTVAHPPHATAYRREGDGWVARTVGDDGAPHDYPIAMVSGHLRIRFFVTRMADGRLQVLPSMYEIPKETWFDYSHLIFGAPTGDFDTPPTIEPGSATFWTGPVRSWDANCAHCHMSGKEAVPPGPGGTGPRIRWRAYAVDCEACHGPGRLHAEAWGRLEMDEPLVRLETLPLADRTALCTRCHQEGEVLDPPYVLGRDLYDYIDPTLVVHPERADPAGRALELIYDGLPFATSACAGAGGLTCSTCHAPHGSTDRSLLRRPPEDGALCADCHADLVASSTAHSFHQEGGSGNECVLCHMPFLTIERGHGAVADHTIGIPRLGLVADRVQTDACTWCHTGGLGAPTDAPHLTEEELRRAYESWWPDGTEWPRRWMEALARARLDEPGADGALGAVLSDRALPREVRASAAFLLGRYAPRAGEAILAASHDADALVRRSAVKALAAVEGARATARIREALADSSWAVRLAAARAALEGWTRVQEDRALLEAVVPVLAEDARRVPDDDRRWFRLGAAYDLLGDRERALDAYEQKARLDPFAHAVQRRVKNLRALLGRDD